MSFQDLVDDFSWPKVPVFKWPLTTFEPESDEHALTRNIDKKLEHLGLIIIDKTWNDLLGDTDIKRENVNLTLYGEIFIKFILDRNSI